jgi:hypothetical protein
MGILTFPEKGGRALSLRQAGTGQVMQNPFYLCAGFVKSAGRKAA